MDKITTELLGVCQFALKKLNTMTTKDFSNGGDKEIRTRLQAVIDRAAGYHVGSVSDPRD